MSEHTPGPWTWVDHGGYYTLESPSGRVLDDGSAAGEYNREIEPDSADGCLVAAAPDLLAALKRVLEDCKAARIQPFSIDQARAAIKKAASQ